MKNKELVNKLIEFKYRISFAESCTGGLLASSIVDIADASKVFNESFVTYANEAKIKYLGVNESTISNYGVVSEQVVKEMVVGVCDATSSECAIVTSGIAGPGGGTLQKPVGMVCFGFKVNDLIVTKTKYFGNIGRNEVRKESVKYAINTMLDLLIESH